MTVEKPVDPGAAEIDPRFLPPVDAIPYWPLNAAFDMHIYLSTLPKFDIYTKWTSAYRKDKDEGLPHFVWENITYGNYNDHRVANFMVNFPEVSSGSDFGRLWNHVCVFYIVRAEKRLALGGYLPRKRWCKP